MNNLLSKKELHKLATIHDQHCVSIYIPTSRSGAEQKGKIILKNNLKEVKSNLQNYGLSETEIEDYLEPAEKLVNDYLFWKNQSDCLVIFLKDQYCKTYTLPIDFDEFNYISDHFYLKPVFNLFQENRKFFILKLSLNEVKIFECTRYAITEIAIEDLVPEKLEDAVGYDLENRSLQFRTGQGGETGAIYHGQGAGKDDKEVEIEKFFRAVDKGILNLMKNENAPLLLACVDHYHPNYTKITGYSNLFNKNISGNPENIDTILLHEKACLLLDDFFQEDKNKYLETFMNLSIGEKTTIDLNDIIPASIDGRVEVLFVSKNEERYGQFDNVNRTLIVDEELKTGEASLFNMAAINTWLNGGKVYLLEPDEMPVKGSKINALLRY